MTWIHGDKEFGIEAEDGLFKVTEKNINFAIILINFF